MTPSVLLLVLVALVVVLLLVHRSDGDLLRAVAEYTVVAVLALLLAATPSTAGLSSGVTAGVTSGSATVARLVGQAWRAGFPGSRAAPESSTATTRQAGRRSASRPQATRPRTPATTTPAPAPGRSPAAPGAPGRGLLLAVLGVLAVLVLVARRVRHRDLRLAEELTLPLLPGRRRRRRAA
jgi:hypothetical protein